jgi:hypothetical protein
MPSCGGVAWGVSASGLLAAIAVHRRRLLRRRARLRLPDQLRGDTGSAVFAAAIAALLLGFGPLRTANGRRLATTTLVCGIAALLVDIYRY